MNFSSTFLDFPRWGADPASKDIFVYPVSINMGNDGIANELLAQFQELSDHQNGVQPIDPRKNHFLRDHTNYFTSGAENSLRNPSKAPRIRFHFDTPYLPDSTAYHFGEIDALLFNSGLAAPGHRIFASPRSCNDVTRSNSLAPEAVRRFFIEACYTNSGSGGFSAPSEGSRQGTGLHAKFDGLVPIHELGHALGLGHGGAEDFSHKPNYVSEMCYEYEHIPNRSFSDGSRPDLLSSNLNEKMPISEEWKNQLQENSRVGRKPKYNIISLQEQIPGRFENGIYIPPTVITRHYADWNHDGILEENVRAPITQRGASARSDFLINHFDPQKPQGHNTFKTSEIEAPLAIVDTPYWVIGLQIHDNKVWANYSGTFSGVCPGGLDDSNPECIFDNATSRPIATAHKSSSVAATYLPSEDQVYLALVHDGKLKISKLLDSISVFEQDISIVGRPDIGVEEGKIHVVWRAPTGEVMHVFGNESQGFETKETHIYSDTTPSLSTYKRNDGTTQLYMMYYDSLLKMVRIKSGAITPSTFDIPQDLESEMRYDKGHVKFEWVADKSNTDTDFDGRWMLVYKNKDKKTSVTYFRYDSDPAPYHVDWGPSAGGQLFEDSEADELYLDLAQRHTGLGVMGISVRPNDPGKWNVRVYPYADGIIPHVFRDYDDMSLIDLCAYRKASFNESTGCGPCDATKPGSCSYN